MDMRSIFDINSLLVNKLGFSNGLWVLIGAILFALLCVFFLLAVRSGRVKARTMLVETGWILLWYFGIQALSLLVYWPKGEALLKPGNPVWVWCPAAVVILLGYILFFRKRRKHYVDQVTANAIRRSAAGSGASKYCYALLFAGSLVATGICIVRVACGDSILHLLVPMFITVLTLLLFSLTQWKFWFALGGVLILVYAFFWMQNVLVYAGFGYTPLLSMIVLFLSLSLPMLSLAFFKQ
jgi:hypothetical protein